MRVVYLILCVTGWVWFVGLFGYLGWRMLRKDPQKKNLSMPEQKD